VLPTFNEADNIRPLIAEIVMNLKESGVTSLEVIVVDDDSPDRTWEVASQTACEGASIKVIRRMSDHGLTPSIREGIAAATHDVVVWLDCDFSHPPDRIPQLIYMLGQGFDVAVNSRYTVGGGEERVGKGGGLQLVLSHTLNWLVRFLLSASFSDYTSGFVGVRRKVLDDIPLRGDYGEYFVDFIYRVIRTNKYRVCELPFLAPPRRSGESKTGTDLGDYWRRGRKYLAVVLALRWKVLLHRL
jgi:dolichol-phosphate mannosyltransferase